MKKNKEGRIIASLTEVKNKTGDIFALADEYGEVILTSYNKPRYKLIKLNVSTLLEEQDEKPKAKKSSPKVKTQRVIDEVQIAPQIEDLKVEVPNTTNELIKSPINIVIWDRDSDGENEFINSISKTLI